ncbi:acyl-CoA thioesterase [Pelagibius marinus]|uniref:acyl-CoA thioesterase n=1 Tax=Pelagibius marinus TaxID=2762760 RepID=UPI00187264CF|nr:acyl-CoA thioesterase [Pelagibius marinus]
MPSKSETPPIGGKPRGGLATRTLAMPADANPNGDIFGGWVLSQMDIAAGIAAGARARGRVATVAVDAMVFHLPVYVGDVLGTYTEVIRVGRTSMAIHVEAWALRGSISASGPNEHVRVTQGTFTLVAIDDNGRPRPVPEKPLPPENEEGAA